MVSGRYKKLALHALVGQLRDLILRKARAITAADAGSLYLVEKDSEAANRALRAPRLRFKLIQNDSVQFPFSEHTLPLTEESIAGYCALHAEVGVREEVLIKAKKLYQLQFVRVLDRFDYIRRDIEAHLAAKGGSAPFPLAQGSREALAHARRGSAALARGTGSLCRVHRQSQRADASSHERL